MYKLSRFNYYTHNLQGDLLLYNSYIGVQSMLKIPAQLVEYYEPFFQQEKDLQELSEKQLEVFSQHGIIVPEEEDELAKLKLVRYNVVNSRILSLIILTTGQCNFRCVYCYESFKDGEMSLETQESIIEFVKKNIGRYSALQVGWFGGEPLCGMGPLKNLSEAFLEICRKQGKPYVANITTNGYLLTLPVVRQLKKWHVLSYQITIDGLEDTHNRQKPLAGGGKTFERVIANLEAIRDHEKSKMLAFTIRTNISREIKAQIKEYQRFYGQRFGGDSRFKYLFRPVMDLGGERVHDFADSMLEAHDFFESIFEIVSDPADGLLPISTSNFQPGNAVCYAAKAGHFVFDPKGNILKCTCNLDDCDPNTIGSVLTDRQWHIDTSKYAAWLNEPHECEKTCFFAPVCLGESCPAARVIQGIEREACPREKRNMRGAILMADTHNQLFQVPEELML